MQPSVAELRRALSRAHYHAGMEWEQGTRKWLVGLGAIRFFGWQRYRMRMRIAIMFHCQAEDKSRQDKNDYAFFFWCENEFLHHPSRSAINFVAHSSGEAECERTDIFS